MDGYGGMGRGRGQSLPYESRHQGLEYEIRHQGPPHMVHHQGVQYEVRQNFGSSRMMGHGPGPTHLPYGGHRAPTNTYQPPAYRNPAHYGHQQRRDDNGRDPGGRELHYERDRMVNRGVVNRGHLGREITPLNPAGFPEPFRRTGFFSRPVTEADMEDVNRQRRVRETTDGRTHPVEAHHRYPSPDRSSRHERGRRAASTITSEPEVFQHERYYLQGKRRREKLVATAHPIDESEYNVYLSEPPYMTSLNNQTYTKDVRLVCMDGDCWSNKLVLVNGAPTLGLLLNDQLPGEVVTIIMPEYPVDEVRYFVDFICNGSINLPKEFRLAVVRLMYSFGWTDPKIVLTDLDGNAVPMDEEPDVVTPPPPPISALFNPFSTANSSQSCDTAHTLNTAEGVERNEENMTVDVEINAVPPDGPENLNQDDEFEPVVPSPPRGQNNCTGEIKADPNPHQIQIPNNPDTENKSSSDDEIEIIPAPIKVATVLDVIEIPDSDEDMEENNIERTEAVIEKTPTKEPTPQSPRKASPRGPLAAPVPVRDGWFQMNAVQKPTPIFHEQNRGTGTRSPRSRGSGNHDATDNSRSSEEFPPLKDATNVADSSGSEGMDVAQPVPDQYDIAMAQILARYSLPLTQQNSDSQQPSVAAAQQGHSEEILAQRRASRPQGAMVRNESHEAIGVPGKEENQNKVEDSSGSGGGGTFIKVGAEEIEPGEIQPKDEGSDQGGYPGRGERGK